MRMGRPFVRAHGRHKGDCQAAGNGSTGTVSTVVPERVTIDLTTVRDMIGPLTPSERPRRHDEGKQLRALAEQGAVELSVAPQGNRAVATGPLAAKIDALRNRGVIRQARQLPYPSDVTVPADDFSPGEGVPGFRDAWSNVVGTWRPGTYKGKKDPPDWTDAWHVESHVSDARDVFITDDGALREMCRRLREEHDIPVVAMSLAEYLAAVR